MRSGDVVEELRVVHPLGLEAGRADRRLRLGVAELRAGVRVLHHEAARLAELLVPDVVRGADGDPGVAGRRLHVDALELGLGTDAPVRDGVQRDAAGEAEVLRAGAPVRGAHEVEVRLLEHRLERRGDVLVVLRQLAARLARGPERLLHPVGEEPADRRRLLVPRHVDAFLVVHEVVELELEPVAVELHELAHLREEALGVAVGREAHHLALVAVLREAEPLRDGRVEDPERVREEHAVEHLEPVAAAVAEHRRGEVAEAVEREHRRLVERRDEERARGVREVVLDVVDVGAEVVGLDAERLGDLRLHVAHLRRVAEALHHVARARPVEDRADDLRADVRARVAADRDVVELARRRARRPRGTSARPAPESRRSA